MITESFAWKWYQLAQICTLQDVTLLLSLGVSMRCSADHLRFHTLLVRITGVPAMTTHACIITIDPNIGIEAG